MEGTECNARSFMEGNVRSWKSVMEGYGRSWKISHGRFDIFSYTEQ